MYDLTDIGPPIVTGHDHIAGRYAHPGRVKTGAHKLARGHEPVDDNHADALALLDWAMAQGGVA